jgi:hypothetical protein
MSRRTSTAGAGIASLPASSSSVILTKQMTTNLQQPSLTTLQAQPAPMLEHKQLEGRESWQDASESPSMDVLRPQRTAEPAEERAIVDQPIPQAELSKEQIRDLIKQIPQLDVNKIADKVARELEKRMRFERQKRGM